MTILSRSDDRARCLTYLNFLAQGEPSQSHIRSALSADGLHFEMEEGLRVAQESPLEAYGLYAAEVLWLEDTASWRMYYAAWEPGAEAAPPPAEVYASARVSAQACRLLLHALTPVSWPSHS